jgi:catechol 2,3-dioxygenase-like lactoylglutathione lyase family enzyme
VVETSGTLSLSRIGQIAVRARDLDAAVAFYRDVLAMPFLFRVPNLAFFQCGEVRLMLSPAERPEHDHPGSVIYYRVDDIRAAHATLKERGVAFIDEPHLIARLPDREVWMAFFHDVSGNTLALMSEPPIAAD